MYKFSWWLDCENIALFRGNGMHLSHRLHMFRRCLRDCKVRGWYFGNGCSKTWFDRQEYIGPDAKMQEKVLTCKNRHCPRYYGWYYWYLRPRCLGLDLGRPQTAASAIQWIHSIRCWSQRRFVRSCCWVSVSCSCYGPFLNPLLNFANLHHLARFAIGIVGDAGVRGTAQQPRLFVGMILILIFAEVLGKTKPNCISRYWFADKDY